MISEIISVGTELLMGQIVNTDARYLAVKMKELGFDLYHQSTVGDNAQKLTELLQLAWSRSDVIITTGGLGPTEDDMTKECVAKFLGQELVLDMDAWKDVVQRLRERGSEPTPSNQKQAMFPRGSRALPNPNGTAPGCILEKDNKYIVILPGPGREMNPMFENYVQPFLQQFVNGVICAEYVQVFGLGEAKVEDAIRDLIDHQSNPTIATYVKPGSVSIRVAAKAASREQAQEMNRPVIGGIIQRLGEHVYEVGERTLPQVVTDYFLKTGRTLSVSESLTGGLLSDAFVQFGGVSKFFELGAVTYSNQSKMGLLGVKEQTLRQFGAVSGQTAREMAEGVRRLTGTQVGLSTTGIAGPTADGSDKPVGLVYIALSDEGGTIVQELRLNGDRDHIRTMTVLYMMDMIRRHYKI